MNIFQNQKKIGQKVKFESDLAKYPIKADSKNALGDDASDFAKKTDVATLKSDVDKLDIDKLENVQSNWSNLKSKLDKLDVDKLVPAPADLSKLNDVVKMMLLKKMYITLISKILKVKYLILLT